MASISGLNSGFATSVSLRSNSQSTPLKTEQATATSKISPEAPTAISGSKTIYEVANDARAALDVSYEDRGARSDSYRGRTGSFRREMFDAMDFDRRTLFAIASDQGGQFSEEEIKAAKSAMRSQLSDAMKSAGGLTGSNHAAGHLAAIEFLDTQASPEEKASLEWAKERAAAQASYQLETKGQGQKVDSDNPVVKLLLDAYDELFAAYDADTNERLENMPSYQRALEEWADLNNTYSSFSITV